MGRAFANRPKREGNAVSWLWLILAIGFEVSGTTCMKMSAGFTKLVPAVAMFALYGLSITALTIALKKIDVGVAYAVWSGLGTVLIACIGAVWFRESLTLTKAAAIGLIIIGVVTLNLCSNAQ